MWFAGWSFGGLGDTPPSDDMVPPLAKFHLLDRGTGPLGFRSDGLAYCTAILAAIRRLLFKCRPRLLPLHTATVVRCVVAPQPQP